MEGQGRSARVHRKQHEKRKETRRRRRRENALLRINNLDDTLIRYLPVRGNHPHRQVQQAYVRPLVPKFGVQQSPLSSFMFHGSNCTF